MKLRQHGHACANSSSNDLLEDKVDNEFKALFFL